MVTNEVVKVLQGLQDWDWIIEMMLSGVLILSNGVIKLRPYKALSCKWIPLDWLTVGMSIEFNGCR